MFIHYLNSFCVHYKMGSPSRPDVNFVSLFCLLCFTTDRETLNVSVSVALETGTV